MSTHPDLSPFDALLLVSYGGPEGPEDVLPFLRNATGGAGIPDSRLEEVGHHYRRFGGVSPINACNRALLAGLKQRLGPDLHYAIGNRNWHPYFAQSLTQLAQLGARRILTLFTTGYSSYSGCRQYRENLAQALHQVTQELGDVNLELARVRSFANTPGFVQANAAAIERCAADLGVFHQAESHGLPAGFTDPATQVVFVTHSIPVDMARRSGPLGSHSLSLDSPAAMPPLPALSDLPPAVFSQGRFPDADLSQRDPDLPPEALSGLLTQTREQDILGKGWGYVAQHLAVAHAITRRLQSRGYNLPWSLAFCSRSGPPQSQWLEPDINDHLHELAARGIRRVIVSPFGFVSDHMEVVFDLDTEARQTAAELGLDYRRADTAGTNPQFLDELAGLVVERAAQERDTPESTAIEPGTFPALAEVCGVDCCQYFNPHARHQH